jgi:transketolase
MAGDRSGDALSTLDATVREIREDLAHRGGPARRDDIEAAFELAGLAAALAAHHRTGDPAHPEPREEDVLLLAADGARIAWEAAVSRSGVSGTDGSRPAPSPARPLPWLELSSPGTDHAVGFAVGMALDARLSGRAERVIAIIGSGDCRSGAIWEALGAARRFQLGRFLLIVAERPPTRPGRIPTGPDPEPLAARFRAFGCRSTEIDGRDLPALVRALDDAAAATDGPSVLIARIGARGKDSPPHGRGEGSHL